MKCFSTLLTLALATTNIGPSVPYSLSTGWDGIWNADGCMFEIRAKDNPVLIEAFHVHMSAKTDNVAVYYRPGHVDYRYDDSYQLIYEAPNVVGAGKGFATPLPPFNPPVVVNPGTPITFYVSVTNNTWEGANLWYTDGEGSGTVMASDSNINVIEGMGAGYPWRGYALNKRWNGFVHYRVQPQPTSSPTESPTSSPTNPPTPKPTRLPTNPPTPKPTSQPTKTNPPTIKLTSKPTNHPTPKPTSQPTNPPTPKPTSQPTYHPTLKPTRQPTNLPTSKPTSLPTNHPTPKPTSQPTNIPTPKPTSQPTYHPTLKPTRQPTNLPTSKPTSLPTRSPTNSPTKSPVVVKSYPTNPPSNYPQLVWKGVKGCTQESPCGVCNGDCDSNEECMSGLECFKRPGSEQVPGCASGGIEDIPGGDYCFDRSAPPTVSSTESPVSSPTNPPTPKPTSLPSYHLTLKPTSLPTRSPTNSPTIIPVVAKTSYPTGLIFSPTATNPTASPVAPHTGSPSGIIDNAGVVDAPTPTITIEPTTTESASTSTKTRMPSGTQAPNDPTDEPSLPPTGEESFPPTKTVTSLLPDFDPSSASSMMFNNSMGRICSYLFPLFITAIFCLLS